MADVGKEVGATRQKPEMDAKENKQRKSRVGGIPVLSLNGSMLCARFMRNGECTYAPCRDLHLDKDKRPICPLFEKSGCCKFGKSCWYPHKKRHNLDIEANVGFQTYGTHLERLKGFLQESVPGIVFVSTAEVTGGKGENKTLLVHAPGGLVAVSEQVSHASFLDVCVDRVYALGASSDDLIDVMTKVLEGLEGGVQGKRFRLRCFPKALERQIGMCGGADTMCSCCSGESHMPKVTLDPKAFTHVLTCVRADGRYHAAVTDRKDAEALPWGGTRRWSSEAVCRAYYKMDEALTIGWPEKGQIGRVVDVGAAPGGWSQCLLERGASHVTAIDPGEITEPAKSMQGLKHCQVKYQVCLPDLIARNQPYDMLVCDVNCAPTEVVAMLSDFLAVLRPGARFVITFKKFSPSGTCTVQKYKENKEEALGVLEGLCDSLTVRHLFNNTAEERTVFGTLKAVRG